MKVLKVFLFSVIAVLALAVNHVYAVKGPYPTWVEKLLNDSVMNLSSNAVLIGNSSGKAVVSLPSEESNMGRRLARATYDVAVDGGTATTTYLLGVKLPAKSLITRSWFYIATPFVDSGTGTVSIQCEDVGNIFAAADITAYASGTSVSGVQNDTIGAFTGDIAAECELSVKVNDASLSAGKKTLFVEYVVTD